MIHPCLCNAKLNFYPRSPCGERRWLRCWQLAARDISIHALLAESDGGSGVGSWPREIFLSTLSLRRATRRHKKHLISQAISIHALLAESDSITGYFFNAVQIISIHALLAESDSKSAQNSGALLRI